MPAVRRAVLVRLAQVAGIYLLQGLLLLGVSGDLHWAGALLYLGIYLLLLLVNGAILLPRHAAMVAERGRLSGTKTWDRIVSGIFSVVTIALLVLAALDHRLAWTPTSSWPPAWAGAVVLVLGWGLFTWAMASNPFFSSLVRIQTERGHYVVDTGPYRFVRHPGYLGQILSLVGTVVLLQSVVGAVVGAAGALLILVRTTLEDRTLHRELAGYMAYEQRVRARLVPWMW